MADLTGVLQALKLGPTIPVSIHPVREFFPLANSEFIERLAADIKANGLRRPIVKCHGAILDGRSRYLACLVAGVEPTFTTFEGTDDAALNFVLSEDILHAEINIHSRAMIAAKIANCEHGGDRRSNQGIILSLEKITIKDAAKRLLVSPSYVKSARKVLEFGSSELIEIVSNGEFPVHIAAQLCEYFEANEVDALVSRPFGVEDLRGALQKRKSARRSGEELVEIKIKVPHAVACEYERLRGGDDRTQFFCDVYVNFKLSDEGQARIEECIVGDPQFTLRQIYSELSAEERAHYVHKCAPRVIDEQAQAA